MKSLSLLAVLFAVPAWAGPPAQESVTPVLGPKAYRDGDVIEIAEVTSTSPRLEQGDTITVRGYVHLKSRDEANLCLYLTQTVGDGLAKSQPKQTQKVSRGVHEFELKKTIRHKGALHLTFYDTATGKPFGGTYFGTKDQMREIAEWDVSDYLND